MEICFEDTGGVIPRNGREYDFKKVIKRGSEDNDGSLDSCMRSQTDLSGR